MITHLIFYFAVGTVVWLFYWMVIRPFILDSAVDELRRMRSNLDWAIIAGKQGANTEAAQELSKNLENCWTARLFSFSTALALRLFRPAEVKAEVARRRALFNNAPTWVREMAERYNVVCMKAALANSPAWWLPLAAILLGSIFSLKVEILLVETETANGKVQCALPGDPVAA